jgi:spore coat polysaccharide biosynthesis predicted glycosyltransferase SpsG
VDVVGRAHHRGLDTLRAMTEEGAGAGRLEIATEANEVGQKLVRCHAAITSGTAWSLELACIGVPQLLVVQDEAYWPTARRLEEEGAATCVGSMENLQPQNFKQAVVDLLADPLERQAMARCGRQLIDGRGPDRLILALEVLLHPYRQIQTFAEAA